MILWRLSSARHARAFDGGYGLLHNGRWNTAGHPVTYCATSPSLCVLEKLVHIEDPLLMPAQVMLRYEVPDSVETETVTILELPVSWRRQEGWTQRRGDQWCHENRTPLLVVPSVIIPLAESPDRNVMINHRRSASARIRLASAEEFKFDPRLL